MSSPISSCSEDYDAAETFAAGLMSQIDNESVWNMVAVQRDMLSRFEKTNEMLINFNILSANRYAVTSAQFRQNTQLLYDMKKDLDSVFKRIRLIKQKLAKSYPDSFKVLNTTVLEDEEEEEESVSGVVPEISSGESVRERCSSKSLEDLHSTSTITQLDETNTDNSDRNIDKNKTSASAVNDTKPENTVIESHEACNNDKTEVQENSTAKTS